MRRLDGIVAALLLCWAAGPSHGQTLLGSLGSVATAGQEDGGSSSTTTPACPGEPFTFQFRVTRKRGGADTALDVAAIQSFFQRDLPTSPGTFKTRTTAAADVCRIATLGVSDQSAKTAAIKAIRATNKKKQAQQQRRRAATKKSAVHAIVQVDGSPALQGIQLGNLEAAIERALLAQAGVAAVRVEASVQAGEASLETFKAQAAATGAAVSLPPRSHTFAAYAASPTFKGYTPVVIAKPDFRGEVPLDLVALSNGAALRSSGGLCAVTAVYRSPRKANAWAALSAIEARAFTVKATSTGVRLSLNLAQSSYFFKLRGQLSLGQNSQTEGAVKEFFQNVGLTLRGIGSSSRRRRDLAATNNSTSGSSTRATQEQEFSTENYATADYVSDYAVVFKCGTVQNLRVDLTLVPRINRGGLAAAGAALVCQPGLAAQGLQNFENDAPVLSASSAGCPTFPKRSSAQTRVLDSGTFEGLHPEEKDWVAGRLARTSLRVAAFIQQNLPTAAGGAIPPPVIDPARAGLRLAVAVSGGGKRSLFNAAGVLSGLHKAGVLNLTTWTSGVSGGAWLLGGLYATSLGKDGLVDPAAYVTARMTDLARSVFDGTFPANDVLTNFGTIGVSLPVAPFAAAPAAGAATADKIFCQAELKFQSPAVPPSQAGSPALAEYWARALGYQLLPQEGGSGLTMSGLARDPLLAQFRAPLPVLQLQQNGGDGASSAGGGGGGGQYNLWEVSPFDIGVHKGDLHVSYPTALLGTDPADASKRCVTNGDQLSLLMGISSWNFALANEVARGTLKTIVCGEQGSACQPIPQTNPFLGHAGPSSSSGQQAQQAGDSGLFTSGEARLVDGAAHWNNPLWAFATPTRRADVAIVIDAGGAVADPPMSTDPPATCVADAATGCGGSGGGTYYAGVSPAKCCSTCHPLLDFGCWPAAASVAENDLFALPSYSPEHTLPRTTWPAARTTDAATLQRLSRRITFFGCAEPNATAVVYVPHRVVASAKGGFMALRNVLELNPAYGLKGEPLTAADLGDVVRNGEAQVSAPALKGCLACLFYASLGEGRDRASFWQATPQCKGCFDEYCFTG